jgi:hypothetical protein
MNIYLASPEQLAKEFQQRIERGADYIADPLAQLDKSTLSQIAPLGEYFFNALESVSAQHEFNDNAKPNPRLAVALMAIHRYGLSWDPGLLQERGFEILSQLLETSGPATVSQVTPLVIAIISHLSPKLRIDQISQLLEREREREESSESEQGEIEIDIHSQLAMSSPRQLFLRHAGTFEALEEVGRSFFVASRALQTTTEHLSDANAHKDLSLPIAFRNTQGAACATGLLIPELLSLGEELDEQLLKDVTSLTDSLSWLVEAGPLARPDFFIKHRRIAEPAAGMLFTLLKDCRMASWLALSLLLNPDASWAEYFEPTRKRLCERAKSVLQDYHDRGSSEPGRIAIELFLATADPGIRRDETALANLHAKLIGILEGYTTRGSPPYQVDGLTAAVVAWQTRNHGERNTAFAKELSASSHAALQGRVFSPRIQEFLVRAAEQDS